ncbi:DUF4332 domain-containing protein [Cyanobium sp. PCC 7001]|uniref:DUF4332 domain-containing protein n=1 Tax=Cyanobium sp. PCC 7001 TaxID=180281 RepID=UPI0005BA4CE7|nr:DUF4332 domain-containing protein [Cyanobium sp. PCC 7001]
MNANTRSGDSPTWTLPPHFSRERRQLEAAGIASWPSLAAMDDATLRQLGRSGGASEARMVRLRGQARLIVEVGLEPADAALLLHAGVPDRRALAEADPQRLLVQMGRLQRRLTGMAAPLISLGTLQGWIRRARG